MFSTNKRRCERTDEWNEGVYVDWALKDIDVKNFHRSLTAMQGLRITRLKQQISLIPFSIEKCDNVVFGLSERLIQKIIIYDNLILEACEYT